MFTYRARNGNDGFHNGGDGANTATQNIFCQNFTIQSIMILTSLKNAHYDMAHGMPKTFEKDNDGSTMYRINVEPEFDPENPETQIGWSCYEIRVFGEVTKSNLEHVFIRSVINETAEFALVNAYNASVLKVKVDSAAVAEYKEFLQFKFDLEARIAADLNV